MLLVALAGCGRAWRRADAWYTGRPDDFGARDSWTQVAEERVVVVPDLAIDRAHQALETRAIVPVTAQMLREWGIETIPGGKHVQLVRAVELNPGHFSAHTRGTHLHVHQSCMGRRPAPMTRVPLLVGTDAPMETLSTSCSMVA